MNKMTMPKGFRLTEDMINSLNVVCSKNISYTLDEIQGVQKVVMSEKHDDQWNIVHIMTSDEVVEKMKLELMHARNSASITFGALKRAGIIVSEEEDDKVLVVNRPHSSMRQWKSWECWIVSKLNFKLWFCECHYQAPYGKVVHGGCEKHD